MTPVIVFGSMLILLRIEGIINWPWRVVLFPLYLLPLTITTCLAVNYGIFKLKALRARRKEKIDREDIRGLISKIDDALNKIGTKE